MKQSNRLKSIAVLEGKRWPDPGVQASHFHRRLYEAVTKPISELKPEELRLLIVQDVGIEFVLSLALDIIEKDPLIEVEHFRGDLLVAALGASPAAYRRLPEVRSRAEKVLQLVPTELEKLDHVDFDTTTEALEEAEEVFRSHSANS